MPTYERTQARGDRAAYERYLAGMDASMRHKVALTAAHLLCEGQVADMGMGSGQGSEALAALYPNLEVTGVDIDPVVVALAAERHRLPNLHFVVGDIAKPVFPSESLDGIFDSSVLHHVTSFGGYRYQNAVEALENQVAQLRPGGVLVVRDFVDPGPDLVWLDLPADDGEDAPDAPPDRASTAALLERFSREFRALSEAPGFPLRRLAPAASPCPVGWRRFELAHKHAAEFVLRKDYREDWPAEVKEEYTYFSQADFESLFTRLGLRVLASAPLRNPWIVRNRFVGRLKLHRTDGVPLPFPATNFLIVGEKVRAGEGVTFVPAVDDNSPTAPSFVKLEHHENVADGRIYDLAARPHPTVDIVPYFRAGGTIYVLARTSYPRPLATASSVPPLDGAGQVAYLVEPLNVLQTDRPLGATVEEALSRVAGITPQRIRSMQNGTTYYPSPGGILEEVRSVFVEMDAIFVAAQVDVQLPPHTGWSTRGRVRAIEARQLLRAAQVGGLPDARLELNVQDLLLRLGEPLGPWIGEAVAEALSRSLIVETTPLANLLTPATAIPADGARRRLPASEAYALHRGRPRPQAPCHAESGDGRTAPAQPEHRRSGVARTRSARAGGHRG